MGRPDGVYPEALAGERDCLNCERTFTPARSGWQAHYCTLACWRANNGGPRRHQAAYRPRPAVAAPLTDPVPEILETVVPQGPLAGGIVWPPSPPPPEPAKSRMVVVGTEHCLRCDTAHQVYGYLEVPGAPR